MMGSFEGLGLRHSGRIVEGFRTVELRPGKAVYLLRMG